MNLIASLALMIVSASAAHAGPACGAIFSESTTLVGQLANLRGEIQSKSAAGEASIARVLYVEFQTKLREAKSAGVDLSSLTEQTKLRDALGEEKLRSERDRNRSARLIEASSTAFWPQTHELSDVGSRMFSPILSPNADRIVYPTKHNSDVSVTIRSLRGDSPSKMIHTVGSLQGYEINWDLGLIAIRDYHHTQGVTVHSLETGEPLFPTKITSNMALAPHAPLLAMAAGLKVSLFDPYTGAVVRDLNFKLGHQLGNRFAFSPDGTRLLIKEQSQAHIFDLSTFEKVSFAIHRDSPVALHPTQPLAFVSDGNGLIQLIDPAQSSKVLWNFDAGHEVSELRVTTSGEKLLYRTASKDLHIVSLSTSVRERSFEKSIDVHSAAFSDNGLAFAHISYTQGEKILIYEHPESVGAK